MLFPITIESVGGMNFPYHLGQSRTTSTLGWLKHGRKLGHYIDDGHGFKMVLFHVSS